MSRYPKMSRYPTDHRFIDESEKTNLEIIQAKIDERRKHSGKTGGRSPRK